MRPAERLYRLGEPASPLESLLEALLWRLRNGLRWLRERGRRARLRLLPPARPTPLRLHIGSRSERLDGWVNIDRLAFSGVGYVADVTRGLPFEDVASLYAEHFLEHLPVDEALGFLLEAHRILRLGGVLRLSTPNLDWVIRAHGDARSTDGERAWAARLNRAFYGWGHRFLWNRSLLEEALAACGFSELDWPPYGESRFPEMRSLERHERYADTSELPHVLIAEGVKGEPSPERLRSLLAALEKEFLDHTERAYSESFWQHEWRRRRRRRRP